MYKLTFTILIAVGIMAFKQPNAHSDEHTNLITTSLVLDIPEIDMNTSEKASKNNIVFDQKHQGDKGKQGKKRDKGTNSQKKNKQPFGKKDNGNHNAIKYVSKKHDNGNKAHGNKKKYDKGHPNFNYIFVNNHGYYSHKNYGQWRSQQAKMKHKKYHPVYEYQAIEGFKLIHTRNVFLYNETDYKINLLNTRLAQKRKSNQIDVVAYEGYTTRIVELQERRAALSININL